jgi:hypothetical protein
MLLIIISLRGNRANFLWYRIFCPYAHAVILNMYKKNPLNMATVMQYYLHIKHAVGVLRKQSLINHGKLS